MAPLFSDSCGEVGAEGEPPLAAGPAWGAPSPPALSERVSASERGGFPTAADRSVPGLRQGARGSRGPCSRGRMSGPAFVHSLREGMAIRRAWIWVRDWDAGMPQPWAPSQLPSPRARVAPKCRVQPAALYQGSARAGLQQSSQQRPPMPWVTFVSPLGFCSDPFVHHKQAFWVWCEAARRHCLFMPLISV